MTRALMVNASFFGTNETPTGLAFPYKRDGAVLTYGSDCAAHGTSARNLHLWWDRQYGAVGTHDCVNGQTALSTYGSAPDIIGGLATSYPKEPTAYRPRTFIGVSDRDGNGTRETLLIYATAAASQSYAQAQLQGFGASEQVMFDGGGSSGFIAAGATYVSPGRTVPNALVVYTAP